MDSVTLDAVDRQLMHALQVDGRAPLSRIAGVLGVSDRTVARRYERLRGAGALRVLGLPEPERVAMAEWVLRIGCVPAATVALAGALARREDTFWVTRAGAELVCLVHAASGPDEVLRLLDRTPGVTSVAAHRLLRTVSDSRGWRGRTSALTDVQIGQLRRPEPAGGGRSPTDPHEGDGALLRLLRGDGRMTCARLASRLHLSESSVRRRIERLRRSGTLRLKVETDPAVFGYTVETVTWLTVLPTRLEAVAGALRTHPEIAYAAAVTGPAALVAFGVHRDAPALYDYQTRRLATLDGVTNAEIGAVVRRFKRFRNI